LRAISQISGKDMFSEEVVRSYWLGNKLTENTYINGRKILIAKYGKIIPLFDRVLEKKLPTHIYLTHLSQVALIVAEHYREPERSDVINHCMIAEAQVIEVNMVNKSVTVEREMLVKEEDAGHQVVVRNRQVTLDPDLTPTLKVGDKVALHLGYVAMILTDKEAVNLSNWTKQVAVEI
jgi:hydrogenase maturation factor